MALYVTNFSWYTSRDFSLKPWYYEIMSWVITVTSLSGRKALVDNVFRDTTPPLSLSDFMILLLKRSFRLNASQCVCSVAKHFTSIWNCHCLLLNSDPIPEPLEMTARLVTPRNMLIHKEKLLSVGMRNRWSVGKNSAFSSERAEPYASQTRRLSSLVADLNFP